MSSQTTHPTSTLSRTSSLTPICPNDANFDFTPFQMAESHEFDMVGENELPGGSFSSPWSLSADSLEEFAESEVFDSGKNVKKQAKKKRKIGSKKKRKIGSNQGKSFKRCPMCGTEANSNRQFRCKAALCGHAFHPSKKRRVSDTSRQIGKLKKKIAEANKIIKKSQEQLRRLEELQRLEESTSGDVLFNEDFPTDFTWDFASEFGMDSIV